MSLKNGRLREELNMTDDRMDSYAEAEMKVSRSNAAEGSSTATATDTVTNERTISPEALHQSEILLRDHIVLLDLESEVPVVENRIQDVLMSGLRYGPGDNVFCSTGHNQSETTCDPSNADESCANGQTKQDTCTMYSSSEEGFNNTTEQTQPNEIGLKENSSQTVDLSEIKEVQCISSVDGNIMLTDHNETTIHANGSNSQDFMDKIEPSAISSNIKCSKTHDVQSEDSKSIESAATGSRTCWGERDDDSDHSEFLAQLQHPDVQLKSDPNRKTKLILESSQKQSKSNGNTISNDSQFKTLDIRIGNEPMSTFENKLVKSPSDTTNSFMEIENIAIEKQPVSEPSLDGNDLPFSDDTKLFINNLPIEILQKILSYFSPRQLCLFIAPVCKKWYGLAYDPLLWLALEFGNHISTFDLCQCLNHAPLLKYLYIRGRRELNLTEVEHIAEVCPQLKELYLGFCDDLNDTLLEVLAQGCRELEILNMEGCHKIDKKCISIICEFPNLHSINLDHCENLQDDSVVHIATTRPFVTLLNIDGISWITDDAINTLVDHHAGNLRSLTVDGAELTDVSFQAISKCCHLEELSVSFAELISDVGLQYIKNLTCLKHLRIKKGTDLTSLGLEALFEGGSLSGLTTLDLAECANLDDEGVQAIVTCCGPVLTHLHLHWCWSISDQGLAVLVDNCRNMEELDLLGIDKITGESFVRIPTKMPHLRKLDLTQCNRINDDLVTEVIKQQPGLVAINYYGEVFCTHEDCIQFGCKYDAR